jgi:hypothetical protein
MAAAVGQLEMAAAALLGLEEGPPNARWVARDPMGSAPRVHPRSDHGTRGPTTPPVPPAAHVQGGAPATPPPAPRPEP